MGYGLHSGKAGFMIKISNLRVPEGADIGHLRHKAAHLLRIGEDEMREFEVLKKSKDARKKNNIVDVYTIAVGTDNDERIVKRVNLSNVRIYEDEAYRFPKHGKIRSSERPVVIGFGPAGIFTALVLAHEGYRPVVYERGKSDDKRAEDANRFFETGVLDPDSNVQFGEGGAGTFSDGKLSSGIKDKEGRKRFILETFVKHGADENILIDQHPHIGTDKLQEIIPSIREEIISLGGEVHFGCLLDDLIVSDGRISGIVVSGRGGGIISCRSVFLCLGHSARDTFKMLYEKGVSMEPKAFAVGVRAEHKREMIDSALHQDKASYKLTYHCSDDRGVYSFCMCPGGYVVNASSERGQLTVNGMSYSARDGENSNSAIVCTISPEDYKGYGTDPLAGVRFQRALEKKAFEECDGAIPYQRFGDFKSGTASKDFGSVKPSCKGSYGMGNVRELLPDYVSDDIIEAMSGFGKKINGYDDPDILFAGIEVRTSSPVRILREDDMQSVNIRGMYPAGEGAGYAGGIMSAAIDGMKAAEAYITSESQILSGV